MKKQRMQMAGPPNFRVGLGFDTHRLAPGGPLRLGGIDLDSDHHALGHSDADVLLHTITDAVLGAACLGDIGRLFPDWEETNRGRNSAEFLVEAMVQVRESGWELVNVDCVVHAEKPRIAPHVERICRRIAEILEVAEDRVGLKGKTGEEVGPIGRREAISAQAVALLWREPVKG
jgi:2-C-methyl-D-erythritol 2,4-cyclodiphosphate synthase